jgi:hypothetical protein
VVERVGAFARRRPGTFLIGAAVTGFLAGRLAKATASAGSAERSDTGEGMAGGEPSSGIPAPAAGTPSPAVSPPVSAPVPGAAGVRPATASYGARPYEDGGQVRPPAGPSGQVR